MSLIVEDGTGMMDSNSYVSVADADAYFKLRGIMTWDILPESDKESALVNGTDYIGVRWPCFKGEPLNEFQALPFPRTEWEGVPEAVKRACMEYALAASEDELWLRPVFDPSGLTVIERTEKLGPIEERFKFGANNSTGVGAVQNFAHFPKADTLMTPFRCSEQGRVVRN